MKGNGHSRQEIPERSSIRLKTSSNSIPLIDGVLFFPLWVPLWLLVVPLLISACAEVQRPAIPKTPSSLRNSGLNGRADRVHTPPPPPWQQLELRSESIATPELKKAHALLAEEKFEEAVAAYAKAERFTTSRSVRDAALAGRVGALLRLGRSREALDVVSRAFHSEGRSIEDISGILAFTIAFAYEHNRDLDQSLAWLALAARKGRASEELQQKVRAELIRLASTLPGPVLSTHADRWKTDPLVGPILEREQFRRQTGGTVQVDVSTAWFGNSGKSGGTNWGEPPGGDSTLPPLTASGGGEGTVKLGVLLPFTGKFSSYAENVRRGIELAVERYSGPLRIELLPADSQGDETVAAHAYEQLVQQGAPVILGPLLVKDSESVAKRSLTLGVPFISFTKKRGIPELGPTVFRLGATAEDQVRELLEFVTRARNIKTFAVISPENEAGLELAEAFVTETRRRGKRLVHVGRYTPGDENSMLAAAGGVKSSGAEGVFIADSLEGVHVIVRKLHAHNEPHTGVTLLGSALWNDPALLRGFGTLLDRAVFVTPFFSSSAHPLVREFCDSFRAKYGVPPDLLSAQAFDATNFLLAQLDFRDNSPASLIQRLRSAPPYTGVTGKLAVNTAGDLIRRMSVLIVQSGEVAEVMSGGTLTGYFQDEQTETYETPST